MISDHRCGEALAFLQETDDNAAELKVQLERKAYLLDLAKRSEFLQATGNIEERKSQAELSRAVSEATEDWLAAMVEHEKMRGRRTTAALIVETWRSVNANRRQGNV